MRTRAEWLADRQERIGASEVGSLFDANEWESRDGLVTRKAGLADDRDLGEAGELAEALEPFVIERARLKFGWDIEAAPKGTQLIDSVEPRLGATPDAYVRTPWGIAVAQIKVACVKQYEQVKKYGGAPPLMYQLQVIAEMAVTGHALGCLLVLHTMGGLVLRAYPVPRNELVIRRIRNEVRAAWTDVETLKSGRVA